MIARLRPGVGESGKSITTGVTARAAYWQGPDFSKPGVTKTANAVRPDNPEIALALFSSQWIIRRRTDYLCRQRLVRPVVAKFVDQLFNAIQFAFVFRHLHQP